MSSLQLFNAMQSGRIVSIRTKSERGLAIVMGRVVGMEAESGTRDINCWNITCQNSLTGERFTTFVRTEG